MSVQAPFLISVHENTSPQRRLLSVRFPTHPQLQVLFPDGCPEVYMLDQTSEGSVAGGHFHPEGKNELFRCLVGQVVVTLRWFDYDLSNSWHQQVLLSPDVPRFLVIPRGVWHEVRFTRRNSALLVMSSTLYRDGTPDEVRALPEGYNASESRPRE